MAGLKRDSVKKLIAFIVFVCIAIFMFDKTTWLFRANETEAREDIFGFRNQGDKDSVDIIFYGGSNVLRYYEPLEVFNRTGYTSYNYATSSAIADLLQAYIEESRTTHDAKLYICDIRTFPMITDDVYEPSVRNWSDSLPIFSAKRFSGISEFVFSRNWWECDVISFYLDIVKYHTNLKQMFSPYQVKYLFPPKIYNVDKGFNPYVNHVVMPKPALTDERTELNKHQEKSLNNLLDYCDKENLNVLFIICPFVMSDSECGILNTCGDIIQARGYDFINFCEMYDELGIDFETDYADVNHVNYLGAEKYTDWFIDYLQDNYDFVDHRGDAAYSSWDEDYRNYKPTQVEWKNTVTAAVNNHLDAKEMGISLSEICDFEAWFDNIQNDNFSVLIAKSGPDKWDIKDDTFNIMTYKWNIDLSQQNYSGVINGTSIIYSENTDEAYEGELGVDGGMGTMHCVLHAGENASINVDGTEYVNGDEGIHIVVLDNNYHKVIDDVSLVNVDGAIVFERD